MLHNNPSSHLAPLKKLLFIIGLSCLFLAASCDPDDEMPPTPEPTLPELTTEGLNTFGCYINGELWVAEIPPLSEITGITKLEAFLNPNSRFFGIRARKTTQDDSTNQRLSVLIENIMGIGVYENKFSPEIYWDVNSSCQYYELDSNYIHNINVVKFDTITKISSGVFSYRLINRNCNDTLKITEGRFDLQFAIVE